MQELTWQQSHIGDLDDSLELINRFHWNIVITQQANQWTVRGGDSVIFRADNYAAVEAFLYGMALACSVVPEASLEQLEHELKS